MGYQSQSDSDLVSAMSKTLAYIHANLDDELTPNQLANVACFSLHYFHRVFRAVVGESVMDHIRRIRLERAAHRLISSRATIATIAMDAGYSAQEAFTRTFQAYYGIGPRMYRSVDSSYILPAASGIHYSPTGFTPLRRAVEPDLLSDEGLCPAHRRVASSGPEQIEHLLSIITGFHFSEISNLPRQQEDTAMSEVITNVDHEIEALLAEIEAAKQRLAEARKKRPKESVKDYVLKDNDGHDVRLSELFGDKNDLIVIHNMGASCIYCTVWADGITGLVPHFSDIAALVMCSPDAPEDQKRFAAKRNWTFTMVSAIVSDFTRDMGFQNDEGYGPGLSTFKKSADGTIYRVAKTNLGPADNFCAVWPVLDMLDSDTNDWTPKYKYE